MSSPSALRRKILDLREDVSREGEVLAMRWEPWIERRDFAFSALNLAHYLALRKRDLRRLQEALMPWGLSSLGRCESRVLPTLDSVLASLDSLCREKTPGVEHPDERTYFRGLRFLAYRANRALGEAPADRHVRIMVTLPSEAASDPALAKDLLSRGASCFRINCAHDEPAAWEAMAAHVRRAEKERGRAAKILMDLAGPKMRIGAVSENVRMEKGVRILLTSDVPAPRAEPAEASCTEPGVVDSLRVGERVMIDDGSAVATVVAVLPRGALLEFTRGKVRKLKPEKGLDFPDSDIRVPPLSDKDRSDLDFALRLADLVGYSFVQTADDIGLLQDEMKARLPATWRSKGIVLEAFVKNGIPTRAEMTDAAMANRAECVMLNKGPFLADGVSLLGRVLSRMETHQFKTTPQLRALQSWR